MTRSSAERAATVATPIYPDLAGKVAVVTGGSKGIGAATCRMLAANGVAVAVVARTPAQIDVLVGELRALGGHAIGLSADVTSADALEHVRIETEQALGPVDILAPFAGGFASRTPIWDLAEAEWRQVLELNLTSTFLTMRAFLPGMIERRRGAMVLMASVGSRFVDLPLTASYVAAKAGVLMLMRHAALELGPLGIRVNAIAPGATRSERTDGMMDDGDRERAAALSPLGRMGMPDDSAAATLFLASDVAGWITGVTLDVCGGRVML